MSERTWGDIESEIRDDYLRADGPDNIQFRDVQWQVWRAEVERAAAARALEEAANTAQAREFPSAYHFGREFGGQLHIKVPAWLRARAAEIRGAK